MLSMLGFYDLCEVKLNACKTYFFLFSLETKKPLSTKQWLEPVIHRCLMCLGDLSRYHLDLVSGDERYYGLS